MDLTKFDRIVVSSSAGKDSQAMLDLVAVEAETQGVLDRLVVVHCDLGRVEWPGTPELAEAHARRYGVRFVKVSRPQGDLLDQVEQRGMWPSSAARYCTSDHKRGQVSKVHTMLAKEHRAAGGRGPVRILNCIGYRHEESPNRAKMPTEPTPNKRETNGRRIVTDWYPIITWTEAEVWERIGIAGTEPHPAYDLGMPRLSCCLCIFAGRDALLVAGHANPELLAEYAAVEERIGHQFRGNPAKPSKSDISMVELHQAVQDGELPEDGPLQAWKA